MNFDLDAETLEMCSVIRRFAEKELADVDDFRRRWRLAGEQGVVGCSVPEAYGGSGLDAVRTAAVMEAFGAGCSDTGFAFSTAAHLFACLMPIAEFGTEEQKRRWLPRLCSGEAIAAHAVTEPQAGSDALSLRTRAERHGDGFLITGDKSFITNAPVADVLILQAATAEGGGYFGLTTFVLDADTQGVRVGPRHQKVGLNGSPTADVRFDECFVPKENVIGSVGSGAMVFGTSMRWERTCLFAVYLGAMKRVIDQTIRYAREREQFGEPIGGFQAVSHRVVDMLGRWEAARLMLYKAATALAAGSDDDISPALAKIAVSEAAVSVGLDAVQLHGGLGVVSPEVGSLVGDALPARVFSGTNEIQKNNVARALGLGARRRGRRR